MSRSESFIRVSSRDPRYFEYDDGTPYIPVGLNLCFPRREGSQSEVLAFMERWLRQLAANGGNFFRVWCSHPFFEVEHERSGVYDADKARRLHAVVKMAREQGLRVKLCLEHFRHLEEDPPRFPGAATFGKPLYRQDGTVTDMTTFFTQPNSRAQFKRKIAWFAEQFRHEPTIFGWELWNEINTVQGEGWLNWTQDMLHELREQFPNHLAMQSLGSFDRDSMRAHYQAVGALEDNQVMQVHRYLDQGAPLAICHGSMAELAADAVRELRAITPQKPVLLAEVGAVEPNHAAPSHLYADDAHGMLLHDLIFAPFFSGAAGCGQSWHWDFYVDDQDLWHHFSRFFEVIQQIDPTGQQFMPFIEQKHPIMVYGLRGNDVTLLWCRDIENTWQTELVEHHMPIQRRDITLAVDAARSASLYDPWTHEHTQVSIQAGHVVIPSLTRSLCLIISHSK